MISFEPLELKDRDIFLKYLADYSFNTYEYTFFTLYFWRKMCSTEFCVIDNAIIVKKADMKGGYSFMQPIGYSRGTIKDIVLRLKEFKDNSQEFASLFADVEPPFLEELKAAFGDNIEFREDNNNFDYIYDSKQLISLTGSKYHRKKNQYNQFVNSYCYEVKELCNPDTRKDCISFAREWYKHRNDGNEQLAYELNGIEDTLWHGELLNMVGIAVYVNNKIVGFAIGEKASNKMAIVHVEKGDPEYRGIYSFINKALAEKYFGDTLFINRQEDMGVPGLRKAKMAYQPVTFAKKYIVDLI